MIYLAVFYRLLGLVADLALLIYAAFFYGLILLIPITMTLPGIAGMILTIGVAADANIVIFERIKEEVRLGKTVYAAISSGYTKGFRTIVDANVVTLITAGVLFMAGTGSVRGSPSRSPSGCSSPCSRRSSPRGPCSACSRASSGSTTPP